MPLDSPVFAFGGFALALLTAWALTRRSPVDADASTRYASIDGLRGFLAFGVFLHHAVIWKGFLTSGVWQTPTSHLYAHLGDSAVVLFFMVTAFLFTGKVIDSRDRPIRWGALYAGRVFRLMPLYLVVVALVCAVVLWATGPHLRVAPSMLVYELRQWICLGVFGTPDINGLQQTSRIVAGVTWTLRYEVLFYAALPLLALLARRRSSIIAGACAVASLYVVLDYAHRTGNDPIGDLYVAFGFGIAAAYAVRRPQLVAFARSRAADALMVAVVVVGVAVNPTGLHVRSIVFFGIAFILIAAGSDLFGLLRTRSARFLGDISYGIYLLHGIVLYVAIVHGIGVARAAELSVIGYWAMIWALAPVVVIVAALGYQLIERPGIAWGRRWPKRPGTRTFDVPAIP